MKKILSCLLFLLVAATGAFAETWVKPSAPIITATLPWENGSVYEPALVRPEHSASGKWELFYSAGWHSAQIGKAICEGGDPENPAHWVKHPTPVLGTTAGNFWASTGHHDILVINGVYHLYFTTTNPYGAHVWLATSTDGTDFEVRQIPVMLMDAHDGVMGNSALMIEDGVIYNWYDANQNPGAGVIWKTYLATAPVEMPWMMEKKRVNPISSFQIGTGVYGGHSVRKVGDWYHAWSINAPTGNTPSYIYHHFSKEGINWGHANGGNPVLTLSPSDYADQIADPHVEDMGTHSLMFYDTTHNPSATARIWVAKMNAPLSSLNPPY